MVHSIHSNTLKFKFLGQIHKGSNVRDYFQTLNITAVQCPELMILKIAMLNFTYMISIHDKTFDMIQSLN